MIIEIKHKNKILNIKLAKKKKKIAAMPEKSYRRSHMRLPTLQFQSLVVSAFIFLFCFLYTLGHMQADLKLPRKPAMAQSLSYLWFGGARRKPKPTFLLPFFFSLLLHVSPGRCSLFFIPYLYFLFISFYFSC